MRLAALAGALALTACDTSVHGIALGPLDANPQCEAAKDPANQNLPWIQSHIFDKHCSSSTACHQDSIDDTDHLQLTDGTSYAALVGVDSQAVYAMPPKADHQWVRVVPGDPANSYLMVLIDPKTNPSGGPSDPNGFDGPVNKMTGSMPASAGELLCPEQIDAIKQWILNGAPEQ